MSEQKFFPITTGVACQLKWTWNTLRLHSGTSDCCHRMSKPVQLTVGSFDEFHNHPQWLIHRQMMLEGNFPQDGCEYCEKIENAGGVSDRLTHLKVPGLVPAELEIDINAIHVTPRILEIYLDNVCNMGCLYCDESDSSWLQTENRQFGYIKELPFNFKSTRHNEYDELVEKFFIYLENNYYGLKRLQILGGEPFYQRSFSRLIDFVKQNKNSDLELSIITNLSLSTQKLETFVNDMKLLLINKQIGRLDITVSLDCFGAEQEYIRYGLKLDIFRRNFEYLVNQKWIRLNVNSTITNLSVKTMPAMIDYLNIFRKDRKIQHELGHVAHKMWLHCNIFGKGFFDTEFTKILNSMPEKTIQDINSKEYMHGLYISLNLNTVDITQINQLESYLNQIDARRNLNWKLIFPWFEQYLLEAKQNNVV